MLKISACVIVAAVFVYGSSANAQSAKRAVTPSGRADMVFKNMPTQDALGRLANTCMDLGLNIVETTSNSVTCDVPMGIGESAITQALIGNSYSTRPQRLVKFNVAQIQNDARVQASARVQTQMAFGQMRAEELTDDATYNDLMTFMEKAGAVFLPGTSFHNYPFMGAGDTEGTKVSYKGKNTVGIVLKDLVIDGPLHNAGALIGDIIIEINGKTFKNSREFDRRILSIPFGTSYEVTVLRNGQPYYLTLVSAPRPTAGEDGGKLVLLSEAAKGED